MARLTEKFRARLNLEGDLVGDVGEWKSSHLTRARPWVRCPVLYTKKALYFLSDFCFPWKAAPFLDQLSLKTAESSVKFSHSCALP